MSADEIITIIIAIAFGVAIVGFTVVFVVGVWRDR